MACYDDDCFSEVEFVSAFDTVSNFFDVKFYADQKEIIQNFINGKHTYFSAPTGYGKSLVFQALPVVFDTLNEQALSTSTLIVLSPLRALMENQVKKVTEKGVSAVALHEHLEDIDKILKGK